MELCNLPDETLIHILSNLSLSELISICQTSVYAYQICRDDTLWRNMLFKIFGLRDKINVSSTWYDNYIMAIRLFKLTEKQVQILNMINDTTPESFELLRELKNYDTYIKYEHSVSGKELPLISVVVSHTIVSEGGLGGADIHISSVGTSDYAYTQGIIRPWKLFIFNGVKTSQRENYEMTMEEEMELLTTGYILKTRRKVINHIIYLSKPQINALEYLFKYH